MAITKNELKVRITFLDEVLGTASADPNVHSEYIASKSPDAATLAEEVEAVGVEEVIEKSMTVFPRDADGTPIFFDYQWRGYFKEACSGLRKVKGSASEKLKAFKKEIDLTIFIKERKIPIMLNGVMGDCQRPLRADTAQGPRVALAHSETVPAGSTCEFTIQYLVPEDVKYIKEWLDYGELHGTGQWRNSGKGRFTWEEISD